MNELREVVSEHRSGDGAIDLIDVITFFTRWWKMIFGMGVAGAVAAVIYSSALQQLFQAHVLLIVAERPEVIINDARQSDFITRYHPPRDIESPEILLARMRIPTTYPHEVVASCQFASQAELLRYLGDFSADMQKATFRFSVQHRSPELATQCAEKLFKMIRSQQAELVKNITENLSVGSARVIVMLPGAPTRLAAPVYAADEPVFPQKKRMVSAWCAGGLFMGVLIALLWTMVTWYRQSCFQQSSHKLIE